MGDSKKGKRERVCERERERERDEMETDGNPILLQRKDSAELSFSNCLSCLAFSAWVWHEEALIIHLLAASLQVLRQPSVLPGVIMV